MKINKRLSLVSLILVVLLFSACTLRPEITEEKTIDDRETIQEIDEGDGNSGEIENNPKIEEPAANTGKEDLQDPVSDVEDDDKEPSVEIPELEKEEDTSSEPKETQESIGNTEDEDETIEEKDEPEKRIPSIELLIAEGPLYTEDSQICYYRIKAIIDGYPQPSIDFSKDDSNGAWGDDISQVNLRAGETYELVANAQNTEGSAQATIILEYIESLEDDGQLYDEREIDYTDTENLTIDVDLTSQMVALYYKGYQVRQMTCSGGTESNPTPLGYFTTSQKIYYAWLPKYDVGVYNIIRFKGSYLFHSVPFDKNGVMIEEEYQKLGQPASHGCIRLSVEDAKWLYDTLPLGVSVSIHY